MPVFLLLYAAKVSSFQFQTYQHSCKPVRWLKVSEHVRKQVTEMWKCCTEIGGYNKITHKPYSPIAQISSPTDILISLFLFDFISWKTCYLSTVSPYIKDVEYNRTAAIYVTVALTVFHS